MPLAARGLQVDECRPGAGPRVVFSGLDAQAAQTIEAEFARCGHFVITNAGSFRMEQDVPLLVPEVNLGQLSRMLRAEYLVDAVSLTQVSGIPFRAASMETAILQMIEDSADMSSATGEGSDR